MKASRAALLAVAQLCCAVIAAQPALAETVSSAWSDLWRTPDQQGEALLDAGKPAQAAARFRDPRWRAYADLEAGRLRQATKLLAPFTDAESEYNRGNALARSGQLQAALTAYDAALKQDPTDKDIRHNRDLVERALRQQPPSPQSSSSKGGHGGGGAASGGRQSGSGQQRGSGSQQSSARGSRSTGQGQQASNGSQAGAGHSGSGQQPASPQATGAQGPRSKDSLAQARRDAAFAAALARTQHKAPGAGNTGQTAGSQGNGKSALGSKGRRKAPETGDRVAGGERTPRRKPESEQQLALDQWLRQIPDSPAGLLRRKFLIEHMMRQEYGEDPESAR